MALGVSILTGLHHFVQFFTFSRTRCARGTFWDTYPSRSRSSSPLTCAAWMSQTPVPEFVMALGYPNPDPRSSSMLLRRWARDDLPCVAEAATDTKISRGTTVPAVYTDDAGRAWIERQWPRQTTGHGLSLAVDDIDTGTAVGLVFFGLRRPEGRCEIGYWLARSARGRGLGIEAVVKPTQAAADVSHMVAANCPALTAFSRSADRQEICRTHSGSRHHDGIAI